MTTNQKIAEQLTKPGLPGGTELQSWCIESNNVNTVNLVKKEKSKRSFIEIRPQLDSIPQPREGERQLYTPRIKSKEK